MYGLSHLLRSIGIERWQSDGDGGPIALILAFLPLPPALLLRAPFRALGRGRRGDPTDVLLDVTVATRTLTRLVHEIVTALGPQVLDALFVRPGAGAAARLQVPQNGFLEAFEAEVVHERGLLAQFVAALEAGDIAEIVGGNGAVVGSHEAAFGCATNPSLIGVGVSTRGSRSVIGVGAASMRRHVHIDSDFFGWSHFCCFFGADLGS